MPVQDATSLHFQRKQSQREKNPTPLPSDPKQGKISPNDLQNASSHGSATRLITKKPSTTEPTVRPQGQVKSGINPPRIDTSSHDEETQTKDDPAERSVDGNLFLKTFREQKVMKSRIFRNENRDLLRSDYIPVELPHREKELNQIVSILSTAMHGGLPSNIFIYGTTGTGKTAVILNVKRQVKEIEPYMIERGLRPMRVLYVNCRLHDTKYTLLSKIGNELSRGEDSIPSGWPTERVYQQLIRNLEEVGATVVLVLDEVNALVEKSGDEALYHLSRINSDLESARLTTISITNNPQMWNILNPSVRSTLTPEDVYFESYNAHHLRDILDHRARSCFIDGALSSGVISMCAAIAAQDQGDARIALELLRKAGEIAERSCSDMVEEKHVVYAHQAIETSKTTGVIKGLSFHSKAVLLSIYAHARKGFRKVSTGEVYDVYCKVCDLLMKSPLTQRRVSDLISELDMLGVARSLVISKGRYGRTKEINLAASKEDVREALCKDEDFGDLLEIDVNQRMI